MGVEHITGGITRAVEETEEVVVAVHMDAVDADAVNALMVEKLKQILGGRYVKMGELWNVTPRSPTQITFGLKFQLVTGKRYQN